MTQNKKQFGLWMDSHSATVIGRDHNHQRDFTVLGKVKNSGADNNSNENSAHNHEIAMTQKFFKEIASRLLNADEIHVTGTGQIQEEFITYLRSNPQHKNVSTTECTTNRMSDDRLVEFFEKRFN